jgi:hypothetical protein
MDRRKFLWTAGAASAASATAGSAIREYVNARARADGLQKAAGGSKAVTRASAARAENRGNEGLLLGYLPGSASMVANATAEHRMQEFARGLAWSRWDHAASQASTWSLFKRSSAVHLSIGALQRPSSMSGTLRSLDVIAHFAIDDAPYFAPFGAWSYRANSLAAKQSTTQPLTFTVEVPDRVALEIGYSLNPMAIASGTAAEGSIYLPVGRDGATGLATGFYVLAAASPETGKAPDLGGWMFGGNDGSLVDSSGRQPNFDHVMLAIRPVAI